VLQIQVEFANCAEVRDLDSRNERVPERDIRRLNGLSNARGLLAHLRSQPSRIKTRLAHILYNDMHTNLVLAEEFERHRTPGSEIGLAFTE
jgi:hypothetical protein